MASASNGFAIEETALRSLPLHFSKMREMPWVFDVRLAESDTLRTGEFNCYWFYKSISRTINPNPESWRAAQR
jgi:hypothetical protein